jgi:ATP-dependent DNA helicase RecQ
MRRCRNRSRPITRRSAARGRDGAPADTLTLYGLDDMRLRRLQIEESDASPDQKRVEMQRLNALVALCEAPRCRRQTLLAYFGETTEPCGNCDLCLEGVLSFDGTIEAQKLLSAIVRTGERFGTEHLINLLVGDETDSVRRFGHDRLKTFGVGKDRSKNEWRSLLRQIYAAAWSGPRSIAEYGRWTITDRGERGAQGAGADRAALRRAHEARRPPPRRAPPSEADAVGADRRAGGLLALKRFARTRERKHVPAYVSSPTAASSTCGQQAHHAHRLRLDPRRGASEARTAMRMRSSRSAGARRLKTTHFSQWGGSTR